MDRSEIIITVLFVLSATVNAAVCIAIVILANRRNKITAKDPVERQEKVEEKNVHWSLKDL